MKPSDLQIAVAELPSNGKKFAGELPAEWVTESLLPAYKGSTGLRLELDVTPIAENILVRGKLAVRLDFECSRTLAPASVELTAPFSELFVPGEKHRMTLTDEEVSSDDLTDEPWIIADGVVDLEALVREHLVLAQDPYPVAPGVTRPDDDDDTEPTPLWSSAQQGVDPRWEQLKNLKLD